MKFPNRIIIAALAAAIALPVAASAAKGERKNKNQSSETFATLDKDNDGVITEAEYLAVMKNTLGEEAAKKRFADLDKDKNGKLTKEEFGASTEKKKHKKKSQ